MNLIKSLLPEITYCIAAAIVFITMWNIMSFVYAMFFLGCLLFIVAGYLNNVMNIEVE